jgi:tetratricopeptide (TPR) repeat protein/transcriptional regulator with XRE-family HTH domain
MSDGTDSFGARLRAYRRSSMLSQEELAERSGLSVRAIRDLERGRTRWPYQDSLHRLADALELTGPPRSEFITAAGRRLGTRLGGDSGPRIRSRGVVPRHLPAAAPTFVGREDQLAALSEVLDQPGGTAVIAAIGGMAGVGKTALAVQWAHQVAGQFPDGQLFVNLRGFDPSGTPATPADAAHVLLDALDIPADRVPRTTEAQLGLFRSLLVGKRMLVVLDNARDAGQVRPLLPGSATCRVIVTSRNHLTGLAAIEAAHPLTLDVMTEAEARQLLELRLGAERVASDSSMASRIIERCARLPLALCVTAARAAMRPDLSLAQFAAELASDPGLDAFSDDVDPAADVRAVLSWSYRQLDDEAARMFRLLGLHPGPDISAGAAASVADVPADQARRLLADLARAYLVAQDTTGRFTFHDLLRSYAAEQAQAVEAALRRVLDFYLATATAAALILNPRRLLVDPVSPEPDVVPEEITTGPQALEWFGREYGVLMRLITIAAETGSDVHAWRLPWSVLGLFERRARYEDWAAAYSVALAAAGRLGDRQALAHVHLGYGNCENGRSRWSAAEEHLNHALALFRELGDVQGQAHVLANLGIAARGAGRYRAASELAWRSHGLYEQTGDVAGQAGTLVNIGLYSSELGDYEQSRDILTRALATYRELGDLFGQALSAINLGLVHHTRGDYQQAIACQRLAADFLHDSGHAAGEAEALTNLGDSYHTDGQLTAAADAWRQALAILDELGHTDAEKVRAKLSSL